VRLEKSIKPLGSCVSRYDYAKWGESLANCISDVVAIVYKREQGPWSFGRKLDSEDNKECL
jgi:hypothetical protein